MSEALTHRPAATLHRLCKNLQLRVWNFRTQTPLYAVQGRKERSTFLMLRSLSGLSVPIETLERFSSLPLFFVSGRFATFFFPPTPCTGGRP